MHVVVRFAHAYQDFVADNDCAIFIQSPGLVKRQRLKSVPYVACAQEQVVH